jgi:hypothetical protein
VRLLWHHKGNRRGAQTAAQKIGNRYANLDRIPWSKVYSPEEEIVADLKAVHIPEDGDWFGINPLYKGYEYIHSFAERVQSGRELSPAQMKQAKRLAVEIRKAAAVAEFY